MTHTKCAHCNRIIRADKAVEVGTEVTPFHSDEGGKKILVGPVCFRLYYDKG